MRSQPVRVFRAGARLRFGIRSVAGLLFGIAMIGFGLDLAGPALERFNFSLLNTLLASVHRIAHWPDQPAELDRIAVVLANQASLDDMGETWPPSFRFHQKVLARVLEARPAAVVLDFLLLDDRRDPTLESLVDILQAYREAGIPVFISAGTQAEYRGREVLPALAPYVSQVAGWGAARDGDGLRYPLILSAAGEKPLPSAALAVYRAMCRTVQPADQVWFRRCRSLTATMAETRPMWVMWSGRTPDLSHAFHLRPGEQDRSFDCRPVPSVGGPVAQVTAPTATCGPQPALPAHILVKDQDPRIDAFLAGRAVFYGLDLEGLQDIVQPPTTAHPLPGVFVHSMALENLLRWGGRYLGDTSPSGRWSGTMSGLLRFVLLSMLQAVLAYALLFRLRLHRQARTVTVYETDDPLMLLALRASAARGRPPAGGHVRCSSRSEEHLDMLRTAVYGSGAVLLTFLVGLACVWLDYGWLRLAPLNWVSVFGLLWIGGFASLKLGDIERYRAPKEPDVHDPRD